MNGSNDARIDIPLDHVPTNGSGLHNKHNIIRFGSKSVPDNEKHSMFRGRRHKADPSTDRAVHVGYDGEVDQITTMGKFYRRFFNFSIITRYLVYVLPVALIILIPIIVGATAAKNSRIAGVRIQWFFTWIEIVWLSLWVSKVIAHYLPFLFQVVVGVVNSGIRKYAMVIHSLEIPLSLVGWSVTSLATFKPLMVTADGSPDQDWIDIVQNISAACVVSSLILVVEKTLIQLISINYHRKQFNARIKDSKHTIYLLGLLHQASIKLFPAYCNEFADEDYAIADQLNLARGFGGKDRSNRASGVHTPLRLIQDVGRYGDKLTSAFGNIAHEVTGKEVFNPNSSHSIIVEALERQRTSEALARRIWMSFVIEGHEALTSEDLVEVLGLELADEAAEAFAILDRDGNGDVSLDEMILTVTEIGRERKSIANSMHDVDQAINVLDRLLMMIVLLAVVFVFVAFLNAKFTTTLATTGTALLSLSFVFATSCQEVLGSCIFLFVKHPYDIGDRVDIAKDQFVVEHISLLFTVFRRVQGTGVGRLVQIPNIVLNTLYVENVTRSKVMTEQVSISVSFDTSFEDIQLLKNELLKFVTDKDNSRDFQPSFDIDVLGTTDMSKLDLQIEIRHKSNWSNETVRAARRSKFMCALVAALRAVPIYAPGGGGEVLGTATNPNYSVGISDSAAKENIKEAAEKKEGKRMVPHKPTTNDNSKSEQAAGSDAQIIENLTLRNPAVDAARDEAWTSSRDDTSTLGRASIDNHDIEEMRGLLRRESTRGKRKAGMDARNAQPGVPTIQEPDPVSYPSALGHTGAYGDTLGVNTQYQPYGGYQPTQEYSQAYRPGIPNDASLRNNTATINAQRRRADSEARRQMRPPPIPNEKDESPFGNMRPYSGV